MKLNGIKCTNYTAGELFSALLCETDAEKIKAITPEQLVVQADDGTAIEEFTAYGRLFSIKHNLVDETFVVEFSTITGTEKRLSEIEDFGKALDAKIDESKGVSTIVFTALAHNETLDDVTITEHADVFPKWDENWTGKKGAIVRDGGVLYRSIHDVGKGQNVKPSDNPSMWTPIGNPQDEFPDWSQPLGAHDAYPLEAKVTHSKKKWVSTEENNIWEPGVYGWQEYKEDK